MPGRATIIINNIHNMPSAQIYDPCRLMKRIAHAAYLTVCTVSGKYRVRLSPNTLT